MRVAAIPALLLLLVAPAPAVAADVPEAADDAPAWRVVDTIPLAVGTNELAGGAAAPYLDADGFASSTVIAVGDVIPHDRLVAGAVSGGGYDFGPLFAPVADAIAGADLAVANLETPVAGPALKITGYPMFNAPDALAATLKEVGFDGVTTANNHSMDRRERGVLNTLKTLDEVGLEHAGTAASDAPGAARAWFDLPVGRVALLSYTFSTNGIVVPPSRPWLVNWPIDEAKVTADIAGARAEGADLVLLGLHWGSEYTPTPSDEQRRLAQVFAEAGADAILGGHPHVLQPAEVLVVENGDGVRRQVPVIHSLGNFVSSQRTRPRDAGILFEATWLSLPGLKRPVLQAVTLRPTWVDDSVAVGGYEVVEVSDARAACEAGEDPDLSEADCARLDAVAAEADAMYPGPAAP